MSKKNEDEKVNQEDSSTENTENQQEELNENVSNKDSNVEEKTANDFEDKYLRAQAEIQNLQARFAKEQVNWRTYDGSRLAESLLPAIDNLERALQVTADDEASKQLKTGVEMVYKSINAALEENNIQAFGEIGDRFDPNIHQAIQTVEITDDKKQKAETIAQVMQKGYKISDRTIRTAMVAVYQD